MKMVLVVSYLLGGLLLPNQYMADKDNTVPVVQTASAHIDLHSVNGISLDDNIETVVAKKGIPQQITVDPYFEEVLIYEYTNMNIVFRDNWIDSIEFDEETSFLLLDQSKITATEQAIRIALGEPDFIAEDGLVFQRDEAVLKLFIHPDNKELQRISYYHISSQ